MTPPVDEFSFEDLTEVYRREQRNKTISEVRKDFYPAMRECLEGLRRESEREFAVDQFSTRSKLASNQLMKFQEKSVQVFEFRMGKMMDMALRAAGGAKVDTARLTVEEREMYDEVFALLKERRESLLESLRSRTMEGEEPTLVEAVVPAMVAEARIEEMSSPQPARPEAVSADRGSSMPDVPPAVVAPAPRPSEGEGVPAQPDYVVVRILENIPAFAGPGRNYRLVKEDLVSLPPAIARALVARKKAVGVSTFPGLTPRSSADRRP